jgi:hypothetical protein
MKATKSKGIIHGECIIFQSQIPEGAELENHNTDSVIVAPSEVTGNHHVIDRPRKGVEFFKSGAKRFMKNSVPTNVRCVIAERHDAITIPPGQWEIAVQQEFDYHAMRKQNVAD